MNVLSHRLWLTAALAVGFASLGAAQTKPAYVPGQVIVKFRPGFSGSSRMAHTAINSRVKQDMSALGAQVIQLRPGMSVEQAVKYYRGLAGVQYVEPNYIEKGYFAPNDPRYGSQWWLPKVGSASAWDMTLGSSAVKIAVIDSGVDYNHEDLRGKVILGRDVINEDSDPMDDNGHGTHVAGIAAGNTNNGIGIAGLGFNCQIIAVKVLSGAGVGNVAITAQGIQNAADLGAHVINLSLGGPAETQISKDAIAYAKGKGCIIIAAAGNDGTTNRGYPGAYEDVVCVAATNSNDQKADFSTYGSDWVDVAAPGEGIMSTLPNNSYKEEDGTSMACPVVAGLAGLLKAYSPSSTAVEIRAAIENNTVNVGTFVAKGRINAPAAISSIIRPIEMDAFPKATAIYSEANFAQGRSILGGTGDLRFVDDKTVSVESVYQPKNGWMAASQTTVDFPVNLSDLISAELVIRHRSLREATNSVFLYNFLKGKYEVLKSVPGTDSATTTTIALPKQMGNYMQGGEIRLVTRAYISSRAARNANTFRLHLDQLMVRAKIKPE
ncbi:MAG: S8 family peptidase [Fimbriimonas sp.]